jgi:hypothetical protein
MTLTRKTRLACGLVLGFALVAPAFALTQDEIQSAMSEARAALGHVKSAVGLIEDADETIKSTLPKAQGIQSDHVHQGPVSKPVPWHLPRAKSSRVLLLEELRAVFILKLPAPSFHLYPTRAWSGSVRRVLALRHDPLEAKASALRQQDTGVGKALAEADQVALAAGEQCRQFRPPIHERLIAHVASLQLEQIKAVDAHGHMPAVQ